LQEGIDPASHCSLSISLLLQGRLHLRRIFLRLGHRRSLIHGEQFSVLQQYLPAHHNGFHLAGLQRVDHL